MSQWTHVAGVIRFDALRFRVSDKPDLGITWQFDDSEEKLEKCNVPFGTEGSLQYTVHENPDQSSIAAYVATIWGDLRDYDDEKPIVEYFDRIVKGHMIRGAVFEVDIAFKYRRIYAVRDFNDPKFECVETILYD